MKRSSEPGKFYYDVTIEHDPEHADKKHFVKSKAEKTINLEYPLMENPGDYNISVSKFNINTETLPVMIPEIVSKQKLADITANKCFETSYWIKLTMVYNVCKVISYTGKEQDKKPVWGRWEKNVNYSQIENVKIPFNYDVENLQRVNWETNYEGYVDNTDEQCFIYDYTTFINALNKTTRSISQKVQKIGETQKKDPKTGKIEIISGPMEYFCFTQNLQSFLAFKLENDKIRFQLHQHLWKEYEFSEKKFQVTSFEISFSNNLYRYIGNGFKTRFNDNKSWQYDFYDIKEQQAIQKKDIFRDDQIAYNHVNYTQDYPTLVNWNPLKAIIIGSDTIPAVGEFLPISHQDGWLNHSKTEEYKTFLTDNGYNFHNTDDDIFKKNTMCILDIYYPFLSNPGDIRSTCVFSRNNINDGQSIELVDSSPFTTFNIWIKWLDIYGNLHDLYLLPSCSCDIRFCFVKKTLLKEDFNEGISTVVQALAPPEEKKKKRTKSNGKPDGIVLDGADKYGWIHL